MTPEQIDLIEQYLEETLETAGLNRLLELLSGDRDFRGEFAEACRMTGFLHAGLGPDANCERLANVVGIAIPSGSRGLDSKVMEVIRRRGVQAPRREGGRATSFRRLAIGAGALAACALVAIGAWIARRGAPPASIVAASSEVVVERDGNRRFISAPFSLVSQDGVTVPAGGWAWLRYADGTTLEIGSDTELALQDTSGLSGAKRVRVSRGVVFAEVMPQPPGRPMVLDSPYAQTKVLGTSFSIAVRKESTKLIVHRGKVEFSKPEGGGSVEVTSGRVATAARGKPLATEPVRSELLRRLGKDHFLLGIMSGWAESWVRDTRQQGCQWDLRYQHLSSTWTEWNKGGAFVPMYLEESERLGILPVFTYYGLLRSGQGHQESAELAAEISSNCSNPSTMRRYFSDVRLFMQKAGAWGKPVILHVEPGVWAQFLSAPEFRPNILEEIPVTVRSTEIPELGGLDDSAAAFGKAFGVLRDRFAPNVILAWHVSRMDGLSPSAVADAVVRCGDWDLLFTDVGDRDAGFNEARGVPHAWWSEKDFDEFRKWGAEIYAQTGLSLMVWRIPLGNTYLASCNNTPWHYMDNRAEYWLEGYPSNRHIAEWADAGFIGLLFGGGSVGCTVHLDNAKDGITNPPPVAGNKGERSMFPDDDGGYLRLRAGNYYRSGPVKYARN